MAGSLPTGALAGIGRSGMHRPMGWLANKYVVELAIFAVGYLFYISVKRLFVPDLETVAFENAHKLIELEVTLRFFWEPDIQSWLLDNMRWVVVFFNWAYTLAFFPILIPAAVYLFVFRHKTYVYYRSIFLISYPATWLLYLTVPTAPPRLLQEFGFVDTIQSMGPALYNDRNAVALFNEFSAMPSMHFGWTLLFAIIFLKSRHLPLKLLGVLYPGVSLGAIVVTGNHYIIDAIVGGGIIVGSYSIYVAFRQPAFGPIAWLRPGLARAAHRFRRASGEALRQEPR
jgi:hypothetical protein